MKQFIKKAKYFLQLWDFAWSVPLAMLAFFLFGVALQVVFYNPDDPQGAPGSYDPSFLQVAFYASAMQVFCNGMVFLGMHFNFRGIWRYYKGHTSDDGTVENYSKNDFKAMEPWQRIGFLFLLYFGLSAEWLVLFFALK